MIDILLYVCLPGTVIILGLYIALVVEEARKNRRETGRIQAALKASREI